jgi:putative ABC transport system permease protein
MSYLVTHRTHEIGIRIALGAQPRQVLSLVLGHGARLAAIGVAIGTVAALMLTQLMSGLLFVWRQRMRPPSQRSLFSWS